jgi:hypothetical protein
MSYILTIFANPQTRDPKKCVGLLLSFLLGSVLVDAGAGVQVQGRAGLTYEGGRALVTLQYVDEGQQWSVERDFAAGVLNRELTGDLDVYGYLQVGLNPEIGMTVWGGVGEVGVDLLSLPKIGLNLYLRGELYPEPDEIAVTITSPQDGATQDTNQTVTFNANAVGNPDLKLKAGVELTLRDGSAEDACPGEPPEQRTLLDARSVNFGSACEEAPVNPSGNRYPCTTDIRTGQNIPYPFGAGQEPPARIPREERVIWDSQTLRKYRRDYVCKYKYDAPQLEGKEEWEKIQIHHIHPREYGGTNDFWNLVPLDGVQHRPFTTYWKGWESFRPITGN